MTTPLEDPPLLELLALDPQVSLALPRSPARTGEAMDDRWRIERSGEVSGEETDLQPNGVELEVENGQVAFRLTQAMSEPTEMRVTTGHASDFDGIQSGPYQLRASSLLWQNVELPTDWGATGEIVARATLRGDDGTSTLHAIEVILSDGQITVSHVDSGTTTVDFTAPIETPGLTRANVAARIDTQFRFIRIESDAAGLEFWVYASTDALVWVLLVRETMSADMQGAFLNATLSFSVVSSGQTATGAWVVGSINLLPVTTNFAGTYLQSEDQAGFSFNAGIWAQFGAPLDGPRDDYTYQGNGQWIDLGGNLHYAWISALTFAADDPNQVYAVVVDKDLLFSSNNGGFTWQQRVMPFASRIPPDVTYHRSPLSIYHVASPRSGEVLVLGWRFSTTSDPPGVFRSTDDGVTWTRIAELTSYEPGRYYSGGGMQVSSSKVWWAQQTADVRVTPDVAPNYHVLWADSLPWLVEIGTPAAGQPYLDIPGDGTTEFELPDGTTRTASLALITGCTPGIWAPKIIPPPGVTPGPGFGTVLWEDGAQSVWQHPDGIQGIYGWSGAASVAVPQFLWQPGSIPDANVAEYWALTDDIWKRYSEIKLAAAGKGPPPPPLPDMGGTFPGQWVTLHRIRVNEPIPEPVNSHASVMINGRGLSHDDWPFDYYGLVEPKYPETTATVWQSVVYGPGPPGARLHVAHFDDYFSPKAATDKGLISTRKAGYTMAGALSVVVFDVDASDIADWGPTHFHRLPVMPVAQYAMGIGTWQIVSGEPGSLRLEAAEIGPPGLERTLEYLYFEHPTWQYADLPPNPAGATVTLNPNPYGYPNPAGGLLVASVTVFDGEQLPVPAGWTLVADTPVSSPAVMAAKAGKAGGRTGSVLEFSTGMWMFYATGLWAGGELRPTFVREYKSQDIEFDLRSMHQMVMTRPIDWSSPLVTLDLPAPTSPYWVQVISVGVSSLPAGIPDYQVESATWAIKRANWDGSAAETVASITFPAEGRLPSDSTPTMLQVRAFSDDLCLVSSQAGRNVYRVQAGQGATSIWPDAMDAIPWDAIALDESTYLAVTEAVIPP